MGRRGIRNVDNRIMDEVLRENFKTGISMISTKELARHLHISEPVIFSHFHTKQNLMDRAFEHAWQKIPERTIFPSAEEAVSDPAVYQGYLGRFHEILEEPQAVVFGDNYFHSCYYNAVFAAQVEKTMVDRLVAIFEHYQSGRDREYCRLMVMRYLQNMISSLAQIAKGAVPDDEGNLRLVFGELLFGAYGLLTDHQDI